MAVKCEVCGRLWTTQEQMDYHIHEHPNYATDVMIKDLMRRSPPCDSYSRPAEPEA